MIVRVLEQALNADIGPVSVACDHIDVVEAVKRSRRSRGSDELRTTHRVPIAFRRPQGWSIPTENTNLS